MNIHGYELLTEWMNCFSGRYAKAQKDGKFFSVKKYHASVAPIDNGTLDAKTIAHNQKQFDDFVALRKRWNTSLRALDCTDGSIIVPVEEFIDGNQYVEVSEFVDGVVRKDELPFIFKSLSIESKQLLMKTFAGVLSAIHSIGIVHGDISPENLLLVRNGADEYAGKVIGFGSSYPVGQKPEELIAAIIGTINYYSPELGAYYDAEDENEEMKRRITEKTDIFSLGLVFHFFLSGSLPEAVTLTERLQRRKDRGKVIYPWVALNSGCELKINPMINEAKYISLISDMLSIDPDKRPTASEVLERL